MLTNHAIVLVYMTTLDDDRKRSHVRETSHAYHLPQMRSRHQSHRAASAAKYEYDTPDPHLWTGSETLPSSYGMHGQHAQGASSYAVRDFAMYVDIDDKLVHHFTQLATDRRQDDLTVTDTTSWQRHYPEF